MEPEIQRKNLLFKLRAVNFLSIATIFTHFVPRVTEVQRVECREVEVQTNSQLVLQVTFPPIEAVIQPKRAYVECVRSVV